MEVLQLSFEASSLYLSATTFILLIVALLPFFLQSKQDLPIINPPKPFELTSARAVREFVHSGWKILYDDAKRMGSRPFRVWTDLGLVTILRPLQGEEIRNDRRFSFVEELADMFQANLSGFEPYGQAAADWKPVQNVVKQKITRGLVKMTKPLAEECALVSSEALGTSREWHSVVLKDVIIKIASRMSSRIFVGEKLCRNEQWNHLIIAYVWVRPTCAKLRAQIREAEEFVTAQLESRRQQGAGIEFNDAIQGFEEIVKGRLYNVGATQLMLAIVAIMTTADLLTQALFDIINHPEIQQALREEMVAVLSSQTLSKTALSDMKLLDSVLKESQRLKPVQITGMHRKVTAPVALSDGTRLPTGKTITVSAERMWDSEIYSNPERFDGYRFLNLRKSSTRNDSRFQLVGTSIDHFGFGHGRHACPGRFFAADEAKIALCFLLLEYDWKLNGVDKPVIRKFGFTHEADHAARVSVRKRDPEISLHKEH